MKRKRTEKGEASRSALIEAATKLFAAQGYHVTKVSDIVKAVGLTQAAFYLYFPSKEAIFEEIIQRYKQQLKQLTNTGALVTNLSAHEVQGQVQQNLLNLFHFFQSQPELSKIALLDSPDRLDMKSEIVQQVKTN
jgi:AcrR family transcriptional regulator